jgi:VanZ family protein
MVVIRNRLIPLGTRWLPLLTWMAAIFVASSQTRAEIPSFGVWDLLVKKLGHFLSYALLAFLSWRAAGESDHPYVWAFLITILYAISDEWHQSFVPTRHASALDVAIDSLGGLVMLTLLARRQRRSSRPSP